MTHPWPATLPAPPDPDAPRKLAPAARTGHRALPRRRAASPGTSRAASSAATRCSAACWNAATSAGAARVVDIGCGQGLLASLLQACRDLAARPAAGRRLAGRAAGRGLHRHRADAARRRRARSAAIGTPGRWRPRFVCADMRQAALPRLRPGRHPRRAALRRPCRAGRAAGARAPGPARRAAAGCCCAWATHGQRRAAFAISQWVDRVVTWCAATACRRPGAAAWPNGPELLRAWALRCRPCR
jgi:hypothetical protein